MKPTETCQLTRAHFTAASLLLMRRATCSTLHTAAVRVHRITCRFLILDSLKSPAAYPPQATSSASGITCFPLQQRFQGLRQYSNAVNASARAAQAAWSISGEIATKHVHALSLAGGIALRRSSTVTPRQSNAISFERRDVSSFRRPIGIGGVENVTPTPEPRFRHCQPASVVEWQADHANPRLQTPNLRSPESPGRTLRPVPVVLA